MIAGSNWTHDDWKDFFQREETKRIDGKKCNCKHSTYVHIQPKDRINKLFNWQCMTCHKQFKGT